MTAAYRRGRRFWLRLYRENGQNEPRPCGTSDAAVAKSMARMIEQMRARHQWAYLDAMWTRQVSIGRMWDYWSADRLDQLAAELQDVDLAPYVGQWHAGLTARFGATTARARGGSTPARYLTHVRRLIPAGEPFLRSALTADRITRWLSDLGVSPATRSRHLAALSSFVGYLVDRGVLQHSPIRSGQYPRERDLTKRTRHLTLAESVRLIASFGWGDPMRTVETLAHLGLEWGAISALRRSDVDLSGQTLHAHGTKTASRDRVARIRPFAWPIVEAHIAALLPASPLFPGITYRMAWQAHGAACTAAGIAGYNLHDARHSFAVQLLREGVPHALISANLGHRDETELVRTYGRYRVETADWVRWEQRIENEATAKQRGAK